MLETMIAVALLSVVVVGTLAAFGGIAKVTQPDPQRAAAEHELNRLIAIETGVLKYTDPAAVPLSQAPWATTMPFPGGTPIPITVAAAQIVQAGAAAITMTVTYPHDGTTATVSKTLSLVQKAPPPQAIIHASGRYADPNPAPT
ncbi:MAG: hypothetical protein M3126_10860 [Candidatus Eremiobacteraeota bacterium]|nr:hypothetical protein [Candidatus Eremiobacteraeota bacterium]